MRKLYRSMAKAAMQRAGYSKINKRMRNNQWRRILGIQPVHQFGQNAGTKIPTNYHGPKKPKAGSYNHLLAY